MRARFAIYVFVGTFVQLGSGQILSPEAPSQDAPARVSFEVPAGNRGGPPQELTPSLESRFSLFVSAQAEGRWDTVASMLGKYVGAHHNSPEENRIITAAGRACLISGMQNFPQLSFVVKGYAYSTEILSTPLARRWWYISGDEVIKTELGDVKQHQNELSAYRDGGEWYFTPPDRYREQIRYTKDGLTRDHANEIRVLNPAYSPLAILNLHGFVDKNDDSVLRLTFTLKNRTEKRVAGYALAEFPASDPHYDLNLPETAAVINPGASVRAELEIYRASYICPGAQQDRLLVDAVWFDGGSLWEAPAPDRLRQRAEPLR